MMAPDRPMDTSSLHLDIRGMIKDNHKTILALFHQYLDSPPDSRQTIVEEILHELASHLELEELVFQEIRRWGTTGRKLVEDTELKHEKVKVMIHELQQFEGDDDQATDECFEDMRRSVLALFMAEEHDLLPLTDRAMDA
jgi:hemerythrin HHE cation binding domain-containing protein